MPVSDEQPAGLELRSAPDNLKTLFSDVRDARNRAIKAERRIRDLALMSEDEKKERAGPTRSP